MLGVGIAEVALGFLMVALSILSSWITSRVKIGKLEEKVGSAKEELSLMKVEFQTVNHDVGRDRVDIMHLTSVVDRLENDGKEYRAVLRSLNTTLSELNITLGRMDERMKNVEDYIRK